jgi:ABC-type transporter Mla maintaining outer membrane lipid asymmetry permease subunit MlaE
LTDDASAVALVAVSAKEAWRRTLRAYALWLVGLSLFAGPALIWVQHRKLRELRSTEYIGRVAARGLLTTSAMRIAILAACMATTVFVHHRVAGGERPERRAIGKFFAVAPLLSIIAAPLALFSSSMAMAALFDVGPGAYFDGLLETVTVRDLGIAFAVGCMLTLLVAALVLAVLPGLGALRRLGPKVAVVWVVLSLVMHFAGDPIASKVALLLAPVDQEYQD